jgi:hypothetical protein
MLDILFMRDDTGSNVNESRPVTLGCGTCEVIWAASSGMHCWLCEQEGEAWLWRHRFPAEWKFEAGTVEWG